MSCILEKPRVRLVMSLVLSMATTFLVDLGGDHLTNILIQSSLNHFMLMIMIRTGLSDLLLESFLYHCISENPHWMILLFYLVPVKIYPWKLQLVVLAGGF